MGDEAFVASLHDPGDALSCPFQIFFNVNVRDGEVQDLHSRVSAHPAVSVVDIEEASGSIEDPKAVCRCVEDGSQPGFAVLHAFFVFDLSCNIVSETNDAFPVRKPGC